MEREIKTFEEFKECVGMKCSAILRNTFCEGEIIKELGSYYFLNNKESGTEPKDKLLMGGYLCSYEVSNGNFGGPFKDVKVFLNSPLTKKNNYIRVETPDTEVKIRI